ncbi:MAG TPA: TIGR00730 family Rossman fold protein [Steroidobacteraceae bacterium]|nr:TIGR00730 family Rossman fold protein [Steroidobacteraceae bacterium]
MRATSTSDTAAPGQPLERAVCVYCASSQAAPAEYREAAFRLGEALAGHDISVIYGGGARGSMGALADGALSKGGRVIGILPRFMADLEWGHPGISELRLVEDMRTRKHLMLTGAQAAVALPGGCGTFEELLEAITLKRLGLFLGPIVLVNTRDYFQPLLQMLTRAVEERFMDSRHPLMWQVVAQPEEVPAALERAPAWTVEFRNFAAMQGTAD